jgi:hypothetical protein
MTFFPTARLKVYSRADNNGSHSISGIGHAVIADAKRTLHDDPADSRRNVLKQSKVKRLYTWTCQFCNMEFETENYSQRYCNRTHKELAYRLRKADRLKNAPEREIQLTLIPSTETLESASKPVHDP